MVKTIISILCSILILVGGAFYETDFIKRQFIELNEEIEVVYDKVQDESATEDEVYSLQNSWQDKKKYLHIFIPHNEIKEVDLWIAECIKLVDNKMWSEALSKLEVLKTLSKEIPKTFTISLENIL